MTRKLGIVAALVVALAVVGQAQKKPDFSGTWTPEVAPDAGGGGGRGMAGPMTVKQTADALTIERTTGRGPVTTSYKLDGSESEVTMGQMTVKVSAKWDGDKLVITTKTDNGEQTQTWSLAGDTLTIERAGGRGAGKTTYKKGA